MYLSIKDAWIESAKLLICWSPYMFCNKENTLSHAAEFGDIEKTIMAALRHSFMAVLDELRQKLSTWEVKTATSLTSTDSTCTTALRKAGISA